MSAAHHIYEWAGAFTQAGPAARRYSSSMLPGGGGQEENKKHDVTITILEKNVSKMCCRRARSNLAAAWIGEYYILSARCALQIVLRSVALNILVVVATDGTRSLHGWSLPVCLCCCCVLCFALLLLLPYSPLPACQRRHCCCCCCFRSHTAVCIR